MQVTKGTNIAGFTILDRIGKGGMGDVYNAMQESLNRIVALKVLPPELSRNKEFSGRFESEAKAISLLEHQNIVSIYDFGEDHGLRFFAMQYVEGESLDQRIQREKRLDLKETLEIARQILRALKYAHDHKVIHRDIKPHNVLIDKNNKVFVSDFGIAKIFANTRITNTGMAVGTPEYMSPEQSEGAPLDARTDIYSLGIVLYEMVTGTPPFTAESPLAVAYKQVNDHPRAPYELNNEIPQRLGLIILKALKKDLKQRYESAEEMLDDLDSIAADEPNGRTRTIPVFNYTRRDTPTQDQRIGDRRMGDRRRKTRRQEEVRDTIRILAIPLAILAIGVAYLLYYLFFPPQEETRVRRFKLTQSSPLPPNSKSLWHVVHLTDGDSATSWSENVEGPGLQEYVLFSFRRPMMLTRIGIRNGVQKPGNEEGKDPWLQYNRVKKIELRYSNGKVERHVLSDRKGMQFFTLKMHKTSFVRIAILGIYPGKSRDRTCISEIELLGMRAR